MANTIQGPIWIHNELDNYIGSCEYIERQSPYGYKADEEDIIHRVDIYTNSEYIDLPFGQEKEGLLGFKGWRQNLIIRYSDSHADQWPMNYAIRSNILSGHILDYLLTKGQFRWTKNAPPNYQ